MCDYVNFNFSRGLCGATLIHPDILLTAANCWIFESGIVEIGGLFLFANDGTYIGVDETLPHPEYQYRDDYYKYDIMLVKLAELSTQPLVTYNTDPDYPPLNALVTTIG